MRRGDARILLALLGLSLGIAACAQVGRPPGGPKDVEPPVLRGAEPGSLAVGVDPRAPLRLSFSEKVDRRGVARSLTLIPDVELESPGFDDTTVVFRPRRGWPPDSVVVWHLASDLKDRHGVSMGKSREGAFTTADALPPGVVEGSVSGPDTVTLNLEKVRARLEIPPPEGSRRPTLWRRARADEQGRFRLNWLHLPSGPFGLEVFVDTNDNEKRDERERVARRDSLLLAASDTVLSVGKLVLLDLEGPVRMHFCLADSSDSLLGYWASSLRALPTDSLVASVDSAGAAPDTLALARGDSLRGKVDTPRPKLQIWSARAEGLDDPETVTADSSGCGTIALVPGEWVWGVWWDEDGDGAIDSRDDLTELLVRGELFEVEPERPDTMTVPANWERLLFAPLDTLEVPPVPPDLLAEPDST